MPRNTFFLSLLPYPLSLAFTPPLSAKQSSSPSPRPPESYLSLSQHVPHTFTPDNPSSATPVTPRLPFLERSFARFGTHVARNQIKVLLISCLVITTLLYPALAVQYQTMVSTDSSSVSRPRSMFNAPLLLPLFNPARKDGLGWEDVAGEEEGFPFVQEEGPMSIWEQEGWKVEAGKAEDESVWRVETVWVGSVSHLTDGSASEVEDQPSSHPYLDLPTLLRSSNASSTLGLVHCRNHSNSTLPSSIRPWESWSCFFRMKEGVWDERAWMQLMEEVMKKEQGVAWGRVGTTGRTWHLRKSSPAINSSTETSSSFLLPQHAPSSFELNLWSIPPIMLLYGFLLASTFRSLQTMTQVHDRFGLAFTYVIELACSTTCSGSICVVMGWKLDGVPWFLLPFVIFVVGTENMAHVTRAVTSTPITLTVAERLSLGLQECGPTITYSTICDIVLLQIFGLVVGKKVPPVREFSRFASIVLLADWFLIWTFFSNVISIDMQRLDLADLLRQGSRPPMSPSPSSQAIPSIDPSSPSAIPQVLSPHQRPKERKRRRLQGHGKENSRSLPESFSTKSEALVSGFQSILRARAGRNGSLFILLLSVMGIWGYYGGDGWHLDGGKGRMAAVQQGMKDESRGLGGSLGSGDWLDSRSSLEDVYSYLRPQQSSYVSIFAPPPTAFIIPSPSSPLSPTDFISLKRQSHRPVPLPRPSRSPSSFSIMLDSPWVYFLKVVIFPIFSTTFALYLILLYLLKDADLLDAQRNRLEIGEEWEDESETELAAGGDSDGGDGRIDGVQPTMRVLRGSHQADVSLLAKSASGEICVSVGFDGIAVVWRIDMPEIGERLLLPTRQSVAGARVLFAAIDETGTTCALGFEAGAVFVWSIAKEQFGLTATLLPFTPALIPNSTATSVSHSTAQIGPAPISFIEFLPSSAALASLTSASPTLIVAREDGRLFEFDIPQRTIHLVSLPLPSQSGSYRAFPIWPSPQPSSSLSNPAADSARVAFTSTGQVNIFCREGLAAWILSSSTTFPSSIDIPVTLSFRQLNDLDLSITPILALSLTSNNILIYNTNTSELLLTLPARKGSPITQIKLLDPPTQRCSSCLSPSPPSSILLASTSHSLFVHRILHRPSSSSNAACSCPTFRTSLTLTDRTSFDTFPASPTPLSRHRSYTVPTPTSSTLSVLSPPPPISPLLLTRRLPPSPSAKPSLSPSADYPQASHGVHSRRLSRKNDLEDTSFESNQSMTSVTSKEEDKFSSVFCAQLPSSSSASSLSEHKTPSSSSSSSAVTSPVTASTPSSPLALESILLGSIPISRGGWEVMEGRFVVGIGKGSSFDTPQRPSLDDPRLSTSSARSVHSMASKHSSISTLPRQWTLFSLDLHYPMAGPDLNITHSPLACLTSPRPIPSPNSNHLSSISDVPGASLRRRRNLKLAEAATSALPPLAPTVSHTVVGPFTVISSATTAKERTLLFGLGNSFGRIDWPSTSSPISRPPPSPLRPSDILPRSPSSSSRNR